ncbi:MAG: flagellar biosynthesis anti-sigma factor FlgM [Gammaproteobacteria bacterium]|nr:flagellar biosynthesis anti-sigma factor FlgM [Gammaproteobacteria bacterium]MCW8986495.1 flagellar biosynthesis anti-sigma factor FlgM [Gammaproteobacteria bacterium]MCW9032002.1 flagellar biosynthesis anti-sigma factor FlgM [Gammaproteobacteria bacterium]
MNDITNINSNRAQLNSNQSSSVKSRNEAKQENQSESSVSAAGDRVTLTNTASRLKDIEQQLSSASSVDNARVAEVQSAISNGEYNVDADRIADKMLAFEDFMNK